MKQMYYAKADNTIGTIPFIISISDFSQASQMFSFDITFRHVHHGKGSMMKAYSIQCANNNTGSDGCDDKDTN